MNGWIKLHRKLLENDFLKRDTNALKVFIYLLMLVDRKTGIWEGGRFQLSEHCGLKPTTSYAASMRLVKAKMMTLSSNNKYSTYSIVNWHKYQSCDDNDDDNKMTTRRQQDDNKMTLLQEVKKIKKLISKEERESITQYLVEKGMEKNLAENELSKFISYWTEKNISGTKERWQLEKTFEVKKRLATWFNNINKFNGRSNNDKRFINLDN